MSGNKRVLKQRLGELNKRHRQRSEDKTELIERFKRLSVQADEAERRSEN
ncbi:hypothetical protein SEA_SKOG_121 [Gordonia phage Skog]|uniref:Uncharacterized protein n=1 Tax=Gordonia phage Skog TaxID=2704033 RepID=A0A6G6XKH7_9CAUD|nr:hypothetical protein KHQ85_gp121 [Gordonia phage Skog]QIG58273.1 hypothetical protein SEA_SKOG_121 [Gordonia phage Skog]